jgi:hypothetical protein
MNKSNFDEQERGVGSEPANMADPRIEGDAHLGVIAIGKIREVEVAPWKCGRQGSKMLNFCSLVEITNVNMGYKEMIPQSWGKHNLESEGENSQFQSDRKCNSTYTLQPDEANHKVEANISILLQTPCVFNHAFNRA